MTFYEKSVYEVKFYKNHTYSMKIWILLNIFSMIFTQLFSQKTFKIEGLTPKNDQYLCYLKKKSCHIFDYSIKNGFWVFFLEDVFMKLWLRFLGSKPWDPKLINNRIIFLIYPTHSANSIWFGIVALNITILIWSGKRINTLF